MKIQFRFLGLLVLTLLLFGGLVYGLHSYQVSRSTSTLLQAAKAASEEGNPREALRLYRRFTMVSPTSEAHYEMSNLLKQLGDYTQAFLQLETALRLDPENTEARREIVSTALALGRFSDARSHIEDHLLKEQSEANDPDGKLRFQLGKCFEGLGDFPAARTQFEAVTQQFPKNAQYVGDLANLISSRFDDVKTARAMLNQLVAQSGEAEAYRMRSLFLLKQAGGMTTLDNSLRMEILEQAWADAAKSLELDNESVAARVLAIDAALATDRVDEARKIAEAGIALNPKELRYYGGAAQVELLLRRPDRASELLKTGLREVPGDPDMLWNLAQVEMDLGNTEDVETLLSELRATKAMESGVNYLEARLLMSKGKFREAATVIENSRALFDRNQDLLRQADFMLAMCYENMGYSDQQLTTLQRVVSSSPLWEPGREALAAAFFRAGRYQEAANEYNQIVRRSNPPLAAVLSYARLVLIRGLSEPVNYDWEPLEQILTILEDIPEAKAQRAILQAEYSVATGDSEGALAGLREFLQQNPQSPEVWQAVVALTIRGQDPEKISDALSQARAAVGDSPELRIEEARYLIQRPSEEVDRTRLNELAEFNSAWDEPKKLSFATAFASIYLAIGEFQQSRSMAQIVADSETGESNLSINLMLFDLAYRSKDLESMQESLARVEDIEGKGPLLRVGTAIQASVEAEELKDLPENQARRDALYSLATEQLAEAAIARPQWATIPRLAGQILDRQGKKSAAVEKYVEAINLGEQNPQLVSRAIYLLFDARRFAEADGIVRKLQQQRNPFSSGIARVASQVSLQLENFDRALALAQKSAEDSGEQEDQIWLAQVYDIRGDTVAAEKAYEAAIAIDPTESTPWVSLVQMHARSGKVPKAREVIDRAKESISPTQLSDALAQCYEALDNPTLAKENYLVAVKQNPEDLGLKRRFVQFSLKTDDSDTAMTLLRELTSTAAENTNSEELAWAKRTLAMLLGNREQSDEAKTLIEQNLAANPDNVFDKRALASVLSRRPSPADQADAIRILEEITDRKNVFSMQDNQLLADLYLKADRWAQYTSTMRRILGNGGSDDPTVVRSYASNLLSKREQSEARQWLNRLERLAPDSFSTFSVNAELIYHQVIDRTENIDRLCEFIESKCSEATEEESQTAHNWAAAIAENFGQRLFVNNRRPESEKLFEIAATHHAVLAEGSIEGKRNQVRFLARLGKVDEAVAATGKPTANGIIEIGQHALMGGKMNETQVTELENTMRSVLEDAPNNLELVLSLADLLAWQGDWEGSAEQYEVALKIDKNSVNALNNLATLLGFTKNKPNVALDAINRAIKIAGNRDYLLDTRGSVLLAAGNAAAAEADFRAAIAVNARADRYFHLAQALIAQQKITEARMALIQAKNAGVTATALHPLERDAFQRLESDLQRHRN